MDARVNPTDDPSTSAKNLMTIGPVTRVLQSRLRWTSYTLGFTTHSVHLPNASGTIFYIVIIFAGTTPEYKYY